MQPVCQMTQRGDLYMKIFNTLSGLMSWNFIIVIYSLHQSSKQKQCETKITIHRSHWFVIPRPLTDSSTCQILPCDSYVRYFIKSKIIVLNFITVRYFAQVQRNEHHAKNSNSSFTRLLLSRVPEFVEAKIPRRRVAQTSVRSISHSGALCDKNFVV